MNDWIWKASLKNLDKIHLEGDDKNFQPTESLTDQTEQTEQIKLTSAMATNAFLVWQLPLSKTDQLVLRTKNYNCLLTNNLSLDSGGEFCSDQSLTLTSHNQTLALHDWLQTASN